MTCLKLDTLHLYININTKVIYHFYILKEKATSTNFLVRQICSFTVIFSLDKSL